MTDKQIYPSMSRELGMQRTQLAPQADAAFRAFNAAVFAEGALPVKIKQLIAVAAAHITQCPYCIRGHTRAALKSGATREEIALDAMGATDQPSAPGERGSHA